MAVNTIRLSEFVGHSPAERETRLADFTRGCGEPSTGDVQDLDRRIVDYETHYEMSSAAMLKLFEGQKLRETEDICAWLILLRLREKLGVTNC